MHPSSKPRFLSCYCPVYQRRTLPTVSCRLSFSPHVSVDWLPCHSCNRMMFHVPFLLPQRKTRHCHPLINTQAVGAAVRKVNLADR